MSVRARLYAAVDRPVFHAAADRVPVLRRLGRRLNRHPDGGLVLEDGSVEWEGMSVEFRAPLRVHRRARTRGIENIICRVVRFGAPAGGTVVDVGASYGFVTMVAAQAVGPGGRVVALEANAATHEVLTANIRANDLDDRVDAPRTLVSPDPAIGTPLDDVCGSFDRVDVIKVDTDGSDLDVLHSAARTIDAHRPEVIVETSADQPEIVSWLRERYDHVVDQFGRPVVGPPWPANVIAAQPPTEWLDRCWEAEAG